MSDLITSLSYDPKSGKVAGYYTESLCIAVDTGSEQAAPSKAAPKPVIAPAKPEAGWLTKLLITGSKTDSPVGVGCTKPVNESCQNKIPNSGKISRDPVTYYNYDDPNRGEVTWKIGNITNCDSSSDGPIKVEVVFGVNDIVDATLVRESDKSLSAVISRKLDPGTGGQFAVIITDKFGYSNDKANNLYLYPPNPAQAVEKCNPKAGSLTLVPSELNTKGQIVVGTKVKFILPNVADCDGEPSMLKVVLKAPVIDPKAASSFVAEQEMKLVNGNYEVELSAQTWGVPVTAVVTDLDPLHVDANGKAPTFESSIYSLTPIVNPELTTCEINAKPIAFTPSGPTPADNYDIKSNEPVVWTINSKNCDGTVAGLTASCDFGPLGTVTGTSDSNGVITISTPLTQNIGGPIPCDIIGQNKEVLKNVISLYPPYYKSPITSTVQTACEQVQDKPRAGALSVDPASLDGKGQLTYGSQAIFRLADVTTCDSKAGNFDVLLAAGANSVPMSEDSAQPGVYVASVTASFIGTPVRAQIKDRDRGTTETRELWSLPPVLSPASSICETNGKPSAGVVIGPNPDKDYDINSGTPIKWQAYLKNCDNSTEGLALLCDFGPLGMIAGTVDEKGIATIATPLAEKLGGNGFTCDITSKNGNVLAKGVTLYAPYYAAPVTTVTRCEEATNKPQAGALSIDPTSLNAKGQIVLGSNVNFILSNTTDCDGQPGDLKITLYAGTAVVPMVKDENQYIGTVSNVQYLGSPVYAGIEDNVRKTSSVSSIYSLPPIVAPEPTACETDPMPKATVVTAPNPGTNYDIKSNIPVVWQATTNNCDGTKGLGLSAECDFGSLGSATGNSDASGVITISKVFTQQLGGNGFDCSLTGVNGKTKAAAFKIYAPYYAAPAALTSCEQNVNKPQIGGLSVDPSSLNAQGQIVYGTNVNFVLANTTDCDAEPSDLSAILHAGNSSVNMPKTNGLYIGSLTADYFGVPVTAEVRDNVRNTTGIAYLYSLPPIVPATQGICATAPAPKAFQVEGPTPAKDYNPTANIPAVWKIWAKNCDQTLTGLTANCHFGSLTDASGTGDSSGVITISKVLTSRISGSFNCDITGSNGETQVDGAVLYPPYYTAP